jgi:hypothetical protein
VDVTKPTLGSPNVIDFDVDLGRWPRIQSALTVSESGYVDCDYLLIVRRMDYCRLLAAERAETWEELASFLRVAPGTPRRRDGQRSRHPPPRGDLDGQHVLLAPALSGLRTGR